MAQNAGNLSPRELEIVGRVVDRLCKERGHESESSECEDLAIRAFKKFQDNRCFDEESLALALRQDR